MAETPSPLRLISRHEGKSATRFVLSSGSHVTALLDGHYVCLHKKCIDNGNATTAIARRPCEHIEFVRALDRGEPAPEPRTPFVHPQRAEQDRRSVTGEALATLDVEPMSPLFDDAPHGDDSEDT